MSHPPPEDPLAGRGCALAGRIRARMAATLSAAGGILLATLLTVVATAVVHRYGLGSGLVWAEEAAVWLFVGLVASTLPLAADGPLAMRLDGLASRLPGRVGSAARVTADGVVVHAALVLMIGGSEVVAAVGGHSTVLGLPEGLRFALMVGGGTLTLAMILLARAAADGLPRAALVALTGGALFAAASLLPGGLTPIPSLTVGLLAALALALGAPLPHALLAALSFAGAAGAPLPLAALAQTATAGIGKIVLLAIPFFLLAGEILLRAGLAARLMRFAAALVGHRRSGLPQTALLTSVLFSGASGSSIANAAFGAKVLAPALVERGMPAPRAGAVVAAASMLDNVIPPSIAFLILAVATGLSAGSLMLAGLWAGLLLAGTLSLAVALSTRTAEAPPPRASSRERVTSFVGALPALGLGVIVVAGIRFGLVTVTEASAIAALYALAVTLAGRGLRGGDLAGAFRRAAADTGAVGLLIAAASPFLFLTAVDGLGEAITGWLSGRDWGAASVLAACVLILLGAGLVLDIGAGLLLLAPLLLPAAVAVGLDPIHFGVIVVVALMIGGLTPPVGILVFVVAGTMGLAPGSVFRAVLPYLAALLTGLAILCAAALASARLTWG